LFTIHFKFNYLIILTQKIILFFSSRGHLTVIERPITDCHYLKPNGLCQVEIKRQPQPFRLALRGFKLNDQTIGSFVLLTKIKYEANLCGFYVKYF